MFTGIVEELGIVKSVEKRDNLLRLGIVATFTAGVKIGDSIAVNGVCLTIIGIGDTLQPDNYFFAAGCPHRHQGVLFFDAVSGTLDTTNIASLKLNERVNLEQALKAGDRLGGHIVSGHIDTTGAIKKKIAQSQQAVIEIEVDKKFMLNMVEKGSIAVDGISLTISKIGKSSFTVNIIPHTLKTTTLDFKKQGDSVNIEFDVMAKYASQNSSTPAKSKITEDFLRQHGF